jgi:hypothetical protein
VILTFAVLLGCLAFLEWLNTALTTFTAGQWTPGRRLNGDEIMSGKGPRFLSDSFAIQKVELYQYR